MFLRDENKEAVWQEGTALAVNHESDAFGL
jgi:hypothetical protein